MRIEENKNFEIIEHNKDKAQIKFNDDEIRFDVNSLHDSVFKRMVKYYDDISMSPVEFIITTLLTAISGAVGKYAYWKFSESLRVYLNIWGVISGPSTILKKTSTIVTVLKDLINIDKNLREKYNYLKNEYEKKIKSKKDKENLAKPNRGPLVLPNDVTIESFSDILAHSKKGIMWHSEFGGFLAQLNRSYSQDAKMVLTDLFDVPVGKEISRATKDNIYIERPYFAMIGASTMEWLRRNSSRDDVTTGFFARILFSIRNKNDKELKSIFDLNELTFKSKFYINTREIFDYLVSINEDIIIEADEEAKNIYREYEKRAQKEIENLVNKNDNSIPFMARLMNYTLKIAGLLALVEKKRIVSKIEMENAIVLTNYYKQNIEKLLSDELVDKENIAYKEKTIFEIIRRNNKPLQRSTLLRMNKTKDVKEFDTIIKNLIEKELIEEITIKEKGTKPKKLYKIKNSS